MVYFSAKLPNQGEMTSNENCQNTTPFLSFSIDRILNGHFKTERERLRKNEISLPKFNWLEYTRYNPPKLPSKYQRFCAS